MMTGATGDFIGPNIWGAICLCLAGIIEYASKSIDPKYKLAMNRIVLVILVATLLCLIIPVIAQLTAKPESVEAPAQYEEQYSNLARQIDIYVHSLDLKDSEIHSLNEQLSFARKSLDIQADSHASAVKAMQESLDDTTSKINTLSNELDIAVNNLEHERTKSAHLEGSLKISQESDEDTIGTLFFGNDDVLSSYYAKAYSLLSEKAKRGSREAQLRLAFFLDPRNDKMKVDGVKQDVDDAIRAYKEVQDHPVAQYGIANLYYSEKKDYANAAKWYLEAAYAGYEKAQFMLGYMEGVGQYNVVIPPYDTLFRDAVFIRNFEAGKRRATNK